MTTPQDRTPIPRIQPRRGFAWLPVEQQLSVVALAGLLVLALLPLLIDSGRAGGGQLRQALLRPRSVAAALTRLERHVSFAWWTEGSAGEQRLRQRLLAACCGVLLLGAGAGWKAQELGTTPPTATTPTTTPRQYGRTGQIRARAIIREEG